MLLFEYFKSLLKKWIFYIGLIPWIYDSINAYIPQLSNFRIDEYINSIILLLFFYSYASFQVWKDQKVQYDNLSKKKPHIYVGEFNYIGLFVEILNNGDEDLRDLDIEISWNQDGKIEKRPKSDLQLYKGEQDVGDYYQKINMLQKNKSIKISLIPTYSDDGIVNIAISGIYGNNVSYKENFEIKNNIKK